MKKSETEGINIAGVEYHTVPKDMVEEAIILADMYDLDELMALDLLTTGNYQTIVLCQLNCKISMLPSIVFSSTSNAELSRSPSWISRCFTLL